MMLRGLQHNNQAKGEIIYYIGDMESEAKCSRCEGSLDTKGYPLWCKACRAKNQREYNALLKQMSETRGYAAGVSAFRDHIAKKFEAIGTTATFNGAVAAKWVRGEQISLPQD